MKKKEILGVLSLTVGLSTVALSGCHKQPVVEEQPETVVIETSEIIETTKEIEETSEAIESTVESQEPMIEETQPETPAVETPAEAFTVVDITPVQKYATQSVNLRQGPSTEYDKVGSLSTNQQVTVTGTCEFNGSQWSRLSDGTFVSSKYLSDNKVQTQKPQQPSQPSQGSTGSSSGSSSQVDQPSSGGETIGGFQVRPGHGLCTSNCTGAQ